MTSRYSLLFVAMVALIPSAVFATQPTNCDSVEKVLLEQLSSIHFLHLYSEGIDEGDTVLFINKIWEEESNRCAIENIIRNKKGSKRVQFFAAEILLENCKEIPADIDRAELGKLYAHAIRRNYTRGQNYWGMYAENDTGIVGAHLVKIGKPAIPALTELLHNRWGVHYYGSKSAEEGNAFGYRKKDVAAFYIRIIMNIDLPWPETRKERNIMIKRLKKEIRK
ncbi:MAG: hypothetical protein HY064_04625 [Bacteroidetes bacterium]|nr:hypothetical protein [Bacteroidota bacterium]